MEHIKLEISIDELIKKLTAGSQKDDMRIGYLLGIRENESVVVKDVYVPQQRSNNSMSSVMMRFQPSMINEINAKNVLRDGQEILGFVQYSGQFDDYENAQTRRTNNNLAEALGKPVYSIIVNSAGEVREMDVE